MTHRCRDCPRRRMFSLKTGTALHGAKLPYRVCAISIYLLATHVKGVSSMKLHRDLGITQKTAWHLAHRLRKSFVAAGEPFAGPVEMDETYVGGRFRNMPKRKRARLRGRGPVGKIAVAGIRDRATGKVNAQVVTDTDSDTLQRFVLANIEPGARIYTDDHRSYQGLPNHAAVRHSIAEYVRGNVHTNGVESFWSLLKRAHKGTYHQLSRKHLDRYVSEFVGRHNQRGADTIDQMAEIAAGLRGKRLRYKDLVEG